MLGQVISGKFGEICIRQKSDQNIELGELLVAENENAKILLQVYDLLYGSQISQQNLELISGLNLEENSDFQFMDPKLRNYKLAMLKNLITIKKDASTSKILPDFFSHVREIKKEDLSFLAEPQNPLFIGNLRSGSKLLDVPISLAGKEVLSHHILIPATTGKGKSNLLRVILWSCMDKDYCGFLVLDPHDEYYGRNDLGLKDHPSKKLSYYSNNPPPGCNTLKINLKCVEPEHLRGVLSWTDAQRDALALCYKKYGDKWIEAFMLDHTISENIHESTIGVIKRRLSNLLDIRVVDGDLVSKGIFDRIAGETTVNDIVQQIEQAKTVIIDTSSFSDSAEILIGSLIATKILDKHKYYLKTGKLKQRPVISIVIEEAPRVLGKEVLEAGPNIFSTIAREGRKFQIGLCAITQLPSLIPRTILANMNTKIILGIEMAPERSSIIESASQDLSQDSRAIASLDKGEAIVTSNFARFATPIKIPFFPDFVKNTKIEKKVKTEFTGMV
ncbi:MAG: ATP-binding protein [Nanoarchaeota archaeon]|nr:ATP-binding protein [Nanoarchaeota archaeon]